MERELSELSGEDSAELFINLLRRLEGRIHGAEVAIGTTLAMVYQRRGPLHGREKERVKKAVRETFDSLKSGIDDSEATAANESHKMFGKGIIAGIDNIQNVFIDRL